MKAPTTQPTPARTRRHLLRFHATHSDDDERAPREGLHTALYSFAVWSGSGLRATSHYDLGIPRDIC